MNMMISYQELVRTFPKSRIANSLALIVFGGTWKKQRLFKEVEGEKDIVGLLKWDKKAKR
ncbi:hypothetical protein GF617_22715 [Lelliottia sp. RWM.1]|nr:hypothetical protein [Lelliottia sp. RWM.1]